MTAGDGYVIRAAQVGKSYGLTPAVRSVDLDVRGGQSVALVGPSGSGKTTLLYCLAGILRPDVGTITMDGTDLINSTDAELSSLRLSKMGFVMQFGDLIPELTLRENVGLPLSLLGWSQRDIRERTDQLFKAFSLSNVTERLPGAASGGQVQRAAVARALAHRPRVILADEPTGSLDSENGDAVLSELLSSAREGGSAVIIVTHEERVAERADRVVRLVDGFVTDGGTR